MQVKLVTLPFSKRFEKALQEGRLAPSLADRARKRLWQVLMKFDDSYGYQPDPNDRWIEYSSASRMVEMDLAKLYGSKDFDLRSGQKAEGLCEAFLVEAPAPHVFDAVQYWVGYLYGDEKIYAFHREINQVLDQEHVGWIFSAGHFFKLDSEFMAEAVLNKATDLLVSGDYDGPLEEFVKAREHLDAEDYKEAVDYACMAYESTLKVVVGQDHGTALELAKKLPKDIYQGVPDSLAGQMNAKVWDALPTLRNKLGGHGQGPRSTSPPREFAELAVHLSGAFIHFLIRRKMALLEDAQPPTFGPAQSSEDDLPF